MVLTGCAGPSTINNASSSQNKTLRSVTVRAYPKAWFNADGKVNQSFNPERHYSVKPGGSQRPLYAVDPSNWVHQKSLTSFSAYQRLYTGGVSSGGSDKVQEWPPVRPGAQPKPPACTDPGNDGCDVAYCDPSDIDCVDIAAYPGGPQPGRNCQASPISVSDSIPNKDLSGETTVTDINALYSGHTEVGWLYFGADGVKYIQVNEATQAAYNWGVSSSIPVSPIRGSFGDSSLSGYGPVEPWNGSWKPGTRVYACFSQGQQFG